MPLNGKSVRLALFLICLLLATVALTLGSSVKQAVDVDETIQGDVEAKIDLIANNDPSIIVEAEWRNHCQFRPGPGSTGTVPGGTYTINEVVAPSKKGPGGTCLGNVKGEVTRTADGSTSQFNIHCSTTPSRRDGLFRRSGGCAKRVADMNKEAHQAFKFGKGRAARRQGDKKSRLSPPNLRFNFKKNAAPAKKWPKVAGEARTDAKGSNLKGAGSSLQPATTMGKGAAAGAKGKKMGAKGARKAAQGGAKAAKGGGKAVNSKAPAKGGKKKAKGGNKAAKGIKNQAKGVQKASKRNAVKRGGKASSSEARAKKAVGNRNAVSRAGKARG
ncbi:hypothetical protein DFJ73DRAFT_756736 [Zopfochytrium polystomum]|nr:hypothetical protein DFJ73DRAFT_756736 [Zopfochytrium polystomum]